MRRDIRRIKGIYKIEFLRTSEGTSDKEVGIREDIDIGSKIEIEVDIGDRIAEEIIFGAASKEIRAVTG